MSGDSFYQERSKVMILLIAGIGLVFLARLFYIQVLDQNYKVFSEKNSIRPQVVIPPRGVIYDRKGRMLVQNETMHDFMVVPARLKPFDTAALCQLLEVEQTDLTAAITKARHYNKFTASPVVRGITRIQSGRFLEHQVEYRGFFVQPRTARRYKDGVAAHAIGYLGEANPDEIKNSDGYYQMGDYIGKSGLEKSYEDMLRGKKGVQKILVDAWGREQGPYRKGEEDIEAIPGKDLHTGIDIELQKFAEELMAGKRGSVVAIEPSTGEILTMVSTPAYDPNSLLGRDRAKNYARLVTDNSKPMFNRAISAMYPPGSTVKPVEALMGLQEGVITPTTIIPCSGGYRLSGAHTIGCHSSGNFDVHGSIMMSCNTYYCHLFRLLIDQPKFGNNTAVALEHWTQSMQKFGMGIKIGLDIPNERKGIIPPIKRYNQIYGERGWRSSTVISLGIGQAEISLTPLQLANEAAALANRGHYVVPHFVRSVADKSGKEDLTWETHSTGIDKKYHELVVAAMQDVMERGTAYYHKVKGIPICAKTGTAQNPHGEDHALFIAFAPRDTPKIALAVVIENAGFGGTWAAPVGTLMIEKYLHDSTSRPRMVDWVLSNAYLKKQEAKEGEKKNHDKKEGTIGGAKEKKGKEEDKGKKPEAMAPLNNNDERRQWATAQRWEARRENE